MNKHEATSEYQADMSKRATQDEAQEIAAGVWHRSASQRMIS
jgi:hypothetical protein